MSTLCPGVESLSAAELELVVQCRLEQGRIAQQKQHAPMAARTVLAALKMLQNAHVFRQHKPQPPPPRPSSMKGGHSAGGRKPVDVRLAEPENAQFQYQNFQARSRLDVRLWLQCRLELVQALMMEVRGMGEIKGTASKVVSDLADCRQYCAEGLGEAEVCGDAEGQAHFFLMGAQLNIIEGKSLEHTVSLLEDAICLLRSMPRRSVPGEQLLAACIMFKADLQAAATRPDVNSDQATLESLATYLEAQKIILDQMEQLGEKIEHYYSDGHLDHLSSPCSPMQNVYLPHVQRLAQLKLRIGHAKARNTAKQINAGLCSDEPSMMWVDCLGVLTTALEISQVSACREAALEAEVLLLMGKVQKMLVYLGKYQARSAANTLLEAIKISFINDHDLGLIRQAYLEIALIYLYSSGMVTIKDGSFMESIAGDSGDETSSVVSSRSTERRYKRSKDDSTVESEKSNLKKDKGRPEREETDQEKERRAAWTAIRCGAAVANAQRHRQLLVGDPGVSNQRVGEAGGGGGGTIEVPDFVSLDLLSGYVLGEKKKVYKNEIEEELASMTEAQEPRPAETYDDKVNKARQAARDLSWIHLLGYQSILQRLVSTSTLSLPTGQPSDRNADQEAEEEGEDGRGNELDLGFISHAQFDTGANYDVVRYMMVSGPWVIRLSQLHMYLTSQLKTYSGSCCAPYPPPALTIQGQLGQQPTELNITIKSYASNLSLNSDLEGESISDEQNTPPRAPLPPGSNVDTIKLIPPSNVGSPGLPTTQSSSSIAQGADSEASIQWYQPGLGESDPARPLANAADRRILMLYALTRGRGGGKLIPGFIWVSQHRLNDLHDRLALLSQRAEISLVEKVKKEATPPSPTPSKTKKTQRIKALSPKVQRDEQLESLLKQCLDDAVVLTSSVLEQGPTTQVAEIPFEVSKANIKSLENLFDPSLGMTLKGSDLLPWILKLFP
ncbi:cilia- and flagella-associated protein 54-like [Elysia marginata]|uniref:Cilia- and flagella-associated protein 54-like n=1 Tax=Elysia marginata TaxID=1093978 RepID=A0AAV4JNQ5_9GAST|nr:cilia- and flagella-associated protein 54-like [Elysia marginata]